MIGNFSSIKIQEDLLTLTGHKFSYKYINRTIKKIFEKIVLSKKKTILISGSQGCGKTTLLKLINRNFKNFYKIDPLCISLDDYYLTKIQRIKISKTIHPLLITRGVPGTHSIKKLFETINHFENKKYPIKLIKFDKLSDNRSKNSNIISKQKDILILEGWCCGCTPINNNFLKKNLNKIEKNDYNFVWRNYYNNKLNNEYKLLFKKFKYLIYYQIPKFDYVLNWRLKQEVKFKSKKNKINNIMSEEDINNFILFYEKITKWMMKKTPSKASLIIKINKKQKIVEIKY